MFAVKMKRLIIVGFIFLLSNPGFSLAAAFNGQNLPGGAAIVGGVDSRSYDHSRFNAFRPFGTFVDSSRVLTMDSFFPSSSGSVVEAFMLSEVAAFSRINQFGLVSTNGQFLSMLTGADTVGDSGSMTLAGDDMGSYTFGMQSPVGLFTTDASNNPDKAVHILAMEVTTAGRTTIDNATYSGRSFAFDLLVGDVVLFIEDMLVVGNTGWSNRGSDFDYNDMVVVVRGYDVPEPATLILFGAGLLGLGTLRKRQSH